MAAVEGVEQLIRLPRRLEGDLVAAERAHRRADGPPLPADRLRDDDHDAARTRARSSATCRRSSRPGSSPCRASGRSSRPAWRASWPPARAASRSARWLDAAMRKVELEQAGRAGARGRSRRPSPRPTSSCSRSCARCSGSTRRRRSTSAPRRRRARCSCSSTRSASRWPSCGGCRRPAARAPATRPSGSRSAPSARPRRASRLKLAEDGELLVRSDVVMTGYRNLPEKTAEALDADGWLHTGDIATIDEDGYITIVDRKKELIITAAGKNMSPANIESDAQGRQPADRPGVRDRRRAPLQHGADRARRRLRARLGGPERARGQEPRGAGPRGARSARRCRPASTRPTTSSRASSRSRSSRSSRATGRPAATS